MHRAGSGGSREQEERGEVLHKQESLWRTSLMFGYVHSTADFSCI
ncbi:MAG: hypothetical protein ACUVTG_04990 [Candidatus Oleimicrobiaceae bacterium]